MTPRVVVLAAADRWYEETATTFAFLASHAEIGEARPSRKPELAGIRTWPVSGFERHIVFYRPIAAGIEVVRVLHGVRDIPSVLGDE